jgi:type III restriction enzyme
VQSNVENEFVLQCQADESVQFFFKLPNGFKIPTPIGNYTPDWAVIFQGNKRIYFVAETKSTSVERKLRGDENIKIKIGEKHFELAKSEEVKFVAVNSLNGLKANSI